jgi:hydrogenase/urease accessory protein HupE
MKYWIALMLLAAAGGAAAHPGHAQAGFADGLLHPLAGITSWP